MTRFEQLRKGALEACRLWGHKMRMHRYTISKGRHRATWLCLDCGVCATVDTWHNVGIGGGAVVSECLK